MVVTAASTPISWRRGRGAPRARRRDLACSMPAAAPADSCGACARRPGARCAAASSCSMARPHTSRAQKAAPRSSPARVERLPFADESFDAIFSADVRCHRGVAQEAALGEFRRCFRPAAFWCWTCRPIAGAFGARHRRRQRATLWHRRAERALAAAGFVEAQRTGTAILFPLMVLRRGFAPRAGRRTTSPCCRRRSSGSSSLASRSRSPLPRGASRFRSAARSWRRRC